MTIKGLAKVIAWLVLVGCVAAWLLVGPAIIAISSGPNYEGAGMSRAETQAKIAEQKHSQAQLVTLFFALPAVAVADLAALRLLHRRARTAERPLP